MQYNKLVPINKPTQTSSKTKEPWKATHIITFEEKLSKKEAKETGSKTFDHSFKVMLLPNPWTHRKGKGSIAYTKEEWDLGLNPSWQITVDDDGKEQWIGLSMLGRRGSVKVSKL